MQLCCVLQSEDSDEDEQCALSDKWKYTRSSRRWSRLEFDTESAQHLTPAERQVLAEKSANGDAVNGTGSAPQQQRPVQIHINDSPSVNLFDNRDRSAVRLPASSDAGNFLSVTSAEGSEAGPTSSLRRVSSEKLQGAKSFFKRIESLKSSRKTKRAPPKALPLGDGSARLVIGDPVVVNASAMQERVTRLGCKDISPKSETSSTSLGVDTALDLNSSAPPTTDSGNTSPGQQADDVTSQASRASADDVSGEGGESTAELDRIMFSLGEMEDHIMTSSATTRRAQSQDRRLRFSPEVIGQSKTAPRRRDVSAPQNLQYRISVYDNIASPGSTSALVTSPTHDPQAELDKILADLMVNISGLDQSLNTSSSNTTATGTNTKHCTK